MDDLSVDSYRCLEGIGFESIGTGIEVLIELDVYCVLV